MNTMKHIIWMAALVLTVATLSACSNDDEPTAAEQPAQSRTFTVTTTLSPRNGAATRSTMTDNGDGSISAEWQVGDQLLAFYADNSASGSATTIARVIAVDPSTKAATITLTLTDPKVGNDNIFFGYPYSFYAGTKNPETDQIGTLADINSNYARLWGVGGLYVSSSDVTISNVVMDPLMCIWKFTFKDGSTDITSAITKLVIDFPNNGRTYSVTPTSLSTIYVALSCDYVNQQPICITATTASGVYRKTAARVTLETGKTYTSTGLALKKAEVGKVFGEDGNIYDNAAAATTAGTTAAALITYVGNDAETNTTYNHGLALALTDCTGTSWCSQPDENCPAIRYSAVDGAMNDMAGIANTDGLIAYTAHTHSAASVARDYNDGDYPIGTSEWFLPSAGQWNKMITAAGGYTALRDGFNGIGGTNLANASYWTSTEVSSPNAWAYYFYDGTWVNDTKNGVKSVRSALAF